MNHPRMLNNQTLDALAALYGGAAPAGGTDNNHNALSSFALVQQIQEAQAAQAAAAHHQQQRQQQQQHQAEVARQAALSAIPAEVLQQYLASNGVREHDHVATAAATNVYRGSLAQHQHQHGAPGQAQVSSYAGIPITSHASLAPPSEDARAIALRILMAQQQQQSRQYPEHQQHAGLGSGVGSASPSSVALHQAQVPATAAVAASRTSPYSLPTIDLSRLPAAAAAPQHSLMSLTAPAPPAPLRPTSAASIPSSPAASSARQLYSLPLTVTASLSNHSASPTSQSQKPAVATLPTNTSNNNHKKRAAGPVVQAAASSSSPSLKSRPLKKRHSRDGGGGGATSCASASSTTTAAAAAQVPVGATSSLKSVMSEWEDKKQAKRAANRLSAHLSRKRKKTFMDALKAENEALRHKEQILQSIPDLIVVFDSSGQMPFISASVTRFLDFTAEELQETCFWERLTPDSVRIVKNAFMDALAIKRPHGEDSAPLWNGESKTVELVDRNEGEMKSVGLKGVVHFSGESPECVCSIRREDATVVAASAQSRKASYVKAASTSTSTTEDDSSLSDVSARRNNNAAARNAGADDEGVDEEAKESHRISDVESSLGNQSFNRILD